MVQEKLDKDVGVFVRSRKVQGFRSLGEMIPKP